MKPGCFLLLQFVQKILLLGSSRRHDIVEDLGAKGAEIDVYWIGQKLTQISGSNFTGCLNPKTEAEANQR